MNWSRNVFSFVAGLTFVSLIAAQICPYNVSECECNGLAMTCRNLQELPSVTTDRNSTPISLLYFQGGNISYIPNDRLPPGLVYLEITDLPLTNLADFAFSRSLNTLTGIKFSEVRLKRLPAALRKVTKLKSLVISNTHIHEWNFVTLQILGNSLTELQLNNVGLSAWPSWLSFFPLLRILALTNNSFNFVPDKAFGSIKGALQTLSLETSGLIHVPKALSALTNLTNLDLSGNSITDVDGTPGIEQLNLFSLTNTLDTLTIKSIGLPVFPDLTNFTKLTTLNLGNNQISDVNTSFIPSSTLKVLDLSYNNITAITDTTFANLSLLDTLHLELNPTITISPAAFESLESLRILDLDGTDLTRIPNALTSLTKLEVLKMDRLASLICTCPPPTDLVEWYLSFNGTIILSASCTSGLPISDLPFSLYFSSACLPAPDTTLITSTPSDAPVLAFSVWCRYLCWLIIFVAYLGRV